MTNNDLIELLQAGKVDEFNQFRKDNPDFKIDLSKIDLSYADLSGTNLEGADLYEARLEYADLRDANLSGASLTGANLYAVKFNSKQIPQLLQAHGIKVLENK